MKITNKENLPALLVEAVTYDRYEPGHGDISVTTLIAPPQIRALKAEHGGELVEDASMRIWSVLGSAVHYMIENAKHSMMEKGTWNERNVVEERYYWRMDQDENNAEPKTVSAQVDLFDANDNSLNDFKVTSVWSVKDAIENGKKEWTQQLNIQRYLMAMNGIAVDDLYIIAIARDWNRSGKLRDDKYPPRVAKIKIPMWTMQETEDFILERLALHFGWTMKPPECTPEDCWEKPTKYALMKKGRQSALRLGDSEEFINQYALDKNLASIQADIDGDQVVLKKDHYIDIRIGERMRCENYCEVSDFCEQYQRWRLENE